MQESSMKKALFATRFLLLSSCIAYSSSLQGYQA
jgi:hypothetical protein